MLKREITYDDFDGNTHTETFYFNISKAELVELEVEQKGGFGNWLKSIVEADDEKTLMEQFKRIVLLAYGERSEDGKRFIKTPEMRQDFEYHAAFDVLFIELASQDNAAAVFLKGVLPADMGAAIDEAVAEGTVPKAIEQ